MKTDLRIQIREYVAGVEAGQESISVEEVRLRLDRRDETEPVVGLRPSVDGRRPGRRPWPALVAAVVVLVIFGVFVFVFPGDDPPPTDTLPDPVGGETGYYVPSDVPEGFVLQDMEVHRILGGTSLSYLRDVGGDWLPANGGFRVAAPFGSPIGLPADTDEYLGRILAANPGASEVEVSGHPGVIHETEYVDGPVTTLVSLVAVDDHGGIFEVTALGMTRQEVLSIGEGLGRVTVDEYVDLGSELEWDVLVSDTHDAFEYEVPQSLEVLAEDLDVALGMDILWRSSLAESHIEESAVTTSEEGSVGEPQQAPDGSRSVDIYLDMADFDARAVATMLEDFRGVFFAPQVQETLTDEYVQQVSAGVVLSEDPYVIQAPAGPEPRFDPNELGEELPLVPADSPEVVPASMFFRDPVAPVATEDRPIVVAGSVRQPGSDAEPVTPLLWFTKAPGVNHGLAVAGGTGFGGDGYPLATYGIGFRSGTQTVEGSVLEGRMLYTVPLETSVVQIVTGSSSYWQRPAGGYGAVSWGDTIDEPTTIVAFDADGNQIGEWEVPPG